MMFKIRKLCSSVDEYEVMEDESSDLDSLFARLSNSPGIDVSYSPPILTILFEDDGTFSNYIPAAGPYSMPISEMMSIGPARFLIRIIRANYDPNGHEIRTD